MGSTPASYEWLAPPQPLTPVFYVYLLRSVSDPDQTYVGFTEDLRSRFEAHNAGAAKHTSKFRPWRLECYLAFRDETQARAFERYLKTSSGKAFASKRLWPGAAADPVAET